MQQTKCSGSGDLVGIIKNIPAISEHPIDSKIRKFAGKRVVVYLETLTRMAGCPHPFVYVSPEDDLQNSFRLGAPFIITEDPRLDEAVRMTS